MFTNSAVKAKVAMSVESESRYNLQKVSKAAVKTKTDRNGVVYYSVEFYALTSKGNTCLFCERRTDKAEADKKAAVLNKHSNHIKAEVRFAEAVVFEDGISKKMLFGHALNADYIK